MTPRQDIQAVRDEALVLHKRILDAAFQGYEARNGAVLAAGERLRLAAFDPDFAWIHPLTKLILDIDERLDAETPLTELDAAQVRAEIAAIFGRESATIAVAQA